MSNIKLGNISLNWETLDDDFYILGLINSESSLLTPKLIHNESELRSYYGDFEYRSQYESYLLKKLPILLLPTLTKESEYNKCSLRLNKKGNIQYCHPKYGKVYDNLVTGNIITDKIPENGIIETHLKYFPVISIIQYKDNKSVKVECNLTYIQDELGESNVSIKIDLNELDDPSNTYYVYEELDGYNESQITYSSDPNNLELNKRIKILDGIKVGKEISIKVPLEDKYLPEVILTKYTDDGYKLIKADYSKSNNELKIKLSDSVDINDICRLDARCVMNNRIQVFELLNPYSVINITHQKPKYRVVDLEYNNIYYEANIEYVNDKLIKVFIKDDKELGKSNLIAKLNIIINPAEFDLTKIQNDIESFNTIIDFSECDAEYLKKVAKGSELGGTKNFILLNTGFNLNVLSTNSKPSDLGLDLTSSIYTKFIKYKISNLESLTDDNEIKNSFIKQFYDQYIKWVDNNIFILIDFLIDFVKSWINSEVYRIIQSKDFISYQLELNSDTPFNRFINDSYIEDYWVTDNYSVKTYLSRIIKGDEVAINNLVYEDEDETYIGYDALDYYNNSVLGKVKDFNSDNLKYNDLVWSIPEDKKKILDEIKPFRYESSQYNEYLYGELAWNQAFIELRTSSDPKLDAITVTDVLTDYNDGSDKFSLSEWFNIPIYKLFIKYSIPQLDTNYFKFDNLIIYKNDNYSNDVLSQLTETYKLLEFYSIPKGPVGKNIQIDIKKHSDYEGVYNLTISNVDITENYNFYIVDPYNIYSDFIRFDQINEFSRLVKVKSYTYLKDGLLVSYDDLDIDEYNPNNDLANYKRLLPSNFSELDSDDQQKLIKSAIEITNNELNVPEGSWKLDRVTPEVYTIDDFITTLTEFSQLGYYPDLVLVDRVDSKLVNYTWEKYIKTVYNLTKAEYRDSNGDLNGLYTQALINLHKEDIKTNYKGVNDWYRNYDNNVYPIDNDNNNRLTYYYGDFTLDYIKYSSLYPYVLDIINSNYLKEFEYQLLSKIFKFDEGNLGLLSDSNSIEVKSDLIRSDCMVVEIEDRYNEYIKLYNDLNNPYEIVSKSVGELVLQTESDKVGEKYHYLFNMKDYCIQNKINYLMYDNLHYYYDTIYEPRDQSSIFIIRFLLSKISRQLLKNKHRLRSSMSNEIPQVLSEILDGIIFLSPLYNSLDYTYNISGNYMRLKVDCQIKYLVNKTYTINYQLNLSDIYE